ncbi:hypothetical protein K8I28_17670 [bacterium]|nr:hypothetical protein [bacterium]
MGRIWLLIPGLLTLFMVSFATDTTSVHVFAEQTLHFSEDEPSTYIVAPDSVAEDGRAVFHAVDLPDWKEVEIKAFLKLLPIPKSEWEVEDRYDRAGNICLVQQDGSLLELIRFMTAFGGPTEHEIDLSMYRAVLQETQTFRVFVDTWGRPGWKVDLVLKYKRVDATEAPDWSTGIFFEEAFNQQEMADGVEVTIEIPENLARVAMVYTSTGHCSDGRGADEFISKPNIIKVDDIAVERLHPWRDDCRQYRDRNPYTGKWSNDTWSSDYSRSGWCPGTVVKSIEIDLTDHLTTGTHKVRFIVENMRPEDEDGNYGFWRISANLVGWEEYPELWKN